MSDLPPCACGGQANLRGGFVSTRYWVECLACPAKTGLHGLHEARQAWREGRLVRHARPLKDEVERLRQALSDQNEKICQVLGQALGYPWFKDDQENFPGATEAQGVCVGDHVAESIAAEAAKQIAALEAEVRRLRVHHSVQRAASRGKQCGDRRCSGCRSLSRACDFQPQRVAVLRAFRGAHSPENPARATRLLKGLAARQAPAHR